MEKLLKQKDVSESITTTTVMREARKMSSSDYNLCTQLTIYKGVIEQVYNTSSCPRNKAAAKARFNLALILHAHLNSEDIRRN